MTHIIFSFLLTMVIVSDIKHKLLNLCILLFRTNIEDHVEEQSDMAKYCTVFKMLVIFMHLDFLINESSSWIAIEERFSSEMYVL